VNLKGYAFCAKAAIPLLRQAAPSSIVNVASVRSVTSIGKTTQYDTTKAAVAGLTRGMAADHAADGIRVNAVCPGPIYTPFTRSAINRAAGRSSSTGMTPPRARSSGVTARRMKSPRASCFSRLATPRT
jgi:NAD(P)-dependent dehydrogenase (short-subunit alcohol dehydrogenase family)